MNEGNRRENRRDEKIGIMKERNDWTYNENVKGRSEMKVEERKKPEIMTRKRRRGKGERLTSSSSLLAISRFIARILDARSDSSEDDTRHL